MISLQVFWIISNNFSSISLLHVIFESSFKLHVELIKHSYFHADLHSNSGCLFSWSRESCERRRRLGLIPFVLILYFHLDVTAETVSER